MTIMKNRASLDIRYASDGKGVVCLEKPGVVPAYAKPDSLAENVGTIIFEEGYVNEKYVFWDAINTD